MTLLRWACGTLWYVGLRVQYCDAIHWLPVRRSACPPREDLLIYVTFLAFRGPETFVAG